MVELTGGERRAGPRVALIVLDGFGIRHEKSGNAIRMANAPVLADLFERFPHAALQTSGPAVGLPPGQMGNSEVGHMTIGGGRVFHQMLTRIDLSIADGSFYQNKVLLESVRAAKQAAGRWHLMGLVSDGGVHSHVRHAEALLELARREALPGDSVLLHAFTDGRDTGPQTGAGFIAHLEAAMKRVGVGRVATVSGRYYAMDRDKRWDRTQRAWDAIVHGQGPTAPTAAAAIEASYRSGVTDEFIVPTVIRTTTTPPGAPVENGDSVLFFNFRPDRARQLTRAFTQADFHEFPEGSRPRVAYATMTQYDATFTTPYAFGTVNTANTIGEIVSRAGMRQLRVAETEKYAHVTYFLNGGEERVFPGEERILVPSPKVATYDQKPEMAAPEIGARVADAIDSEAFALIVVNFANCDMVGHTGDIPATVRAVEEVDRAMARILDAARRHETDVIVTADHGNAEEMLTPEGTPQTAHTTYPVPVAFVPAPGRLLARRGATPAEGMNTFTLEDGTLADVAPTILELLNLPRPKEMTGSSLVLAPALRGKR
ncbi:MAG: 2,3-bisphosphoglycerate-independent phosphoglycerate mutase [Thermoplasmatota archaeon]